MEIINLDLIRSELFLMTFEQAILEDIQEYNTSKSA